MRQSRNGLRPVSFVKKEEYLEGYLLQFVYSDGASVIFAIIELEDGSVTRAEYHTIKFDDVY